MPNRLYGPLALTLFGASILLGACSDDETSSAGGGTGGTVGGSAGKAGGGNGGSAGKASGGSSGKGGSAGSASGGSSGKGGSAGTSAEGGSDSEGGSGNEGGDAGSGGDTGSGGEGGGGAITYACTSGTNHHKLCSAFVAASCPDATDCADCVLTRNAERELFATCPACVAHFDAMIDCAVDAFESGNSSAGVECVPDWGADFTLACYASLDQAVACSSYETEFGCPASWPL